ncbi:hypothetical protein ES702_06854 [subsurface metagenome]
MKKLFLAVSGVFGVIPGVTILLSGLLVPPGKKLLFGGVVEAFGALILVILWANKNKLVKFSSAKATKLSIVFGILFFIFLVIYLILNSFCVVQHGTRGTVYYPLWTSGDLAGMVEKAGGRYAALDMYGIDAVIEATHKSEISLVLTTIILLFVYQAVFSTLTIAFGILGFRKRETL